jgi:signal transduction histidine kinase
MSTQNKIISLLFAILLGFILIFGGFIYYSITQYSYRNFHERLHIRAITTAKIELDFHKDASYMKEFKSEYLEKLAKEKDFIVALDTLTDKNTYARQIGVPPKFISDVILKKEASGNSETRFFTGIKYTVARKEYLVIVSAENYYNTHHVVFLRQLLIATFIVSILLTLFVSFWFSDKITKPLKEISDKVNEIGAGNLNLRIPNIEDNQELAVLTDTFNSMLDRLETSFEAQNNFVSNASHELRTPLTTIIAEADLALSKDRDIDRYKDTLQIILSEAEKLNNKTQALLYLAQTGFSKQNLKFEECRVDELLIDVKHTLNNINPENKLQFQFSNLPKKHERLIVSGNKQLLLLAISNVVSNAIKYSKNDEVKCIVYWEKDTIVVSIEDKGIGVPESEIPFLFDPFFRASNTREFEGYGIGLPLTRNIIRLHGGELEFQSNIPKGLIVRIKLPILQD